MFIISCLIIMLSILSMRMKRYSMNCWKVIFIAVYTGAMGLLGTKIMFWLENGYWVGKSFFGAVLFLPILIFPLAIIFKISLFKLLDYVTPPGMAILVLYKYNCFLDGCCGGKVIKYSAEGIPSYFPSQIVEMICAALVMVILLIIEYKRIAIKQIYPFCLVIYGIIRFVLNFFRWEQIPFVFELSAGHFWSLVSIVIGVVLICLLRTNFKKQLSVSDML